MRNQNTNILKATIKDIIVAFICIAIIFFTIYIVWGSEISLAISLVNKISIDTSKKVLEEVKLNSVTNKLESYPEYGTKYGTIKIDAINADLPLYYGDTLAILRNGVGQFSGGYFPGEGGTVVCMAHNSTKYLRELAKVTPGNKIIITTNYGEFTYEVFDTTIVPQTEMEALKIQNEEEMLVLYTCYPFNSIGHTTSRYITYSKLVDSKYF